MTTTYTDIAEAMLRALESFDAAIGPEGLYAAEEHGVDLPRPRWRLEWDECLLPCLKAFGSVGGLMLKGRMNRDLGAATASIRHSGDAISLTMVRISKIKVRKFGNTYRIDPQFDFAERWKQCRLGSQLKRFQPCQSSRSFLLLIGFDGQKEPLRRELAELNQTSNWERLGWSLRTLYWTDPHKRNFNTRAAIWIPSSQHTTSVS